VACVREKKIYVIISEEKFYKKIVEILQEYYPFYAFVKNETPFGDYFLINIEHDKLFLSVRESHKKIHYDGSVILKETTITGVKHAFYTLMKTLLYPLPWGSLVAVRPMSPLKNLVHLSEKEKLLYYQKNFDTTPFRANLAIKINEIEEKLLEEYKDNVGLYINIPFCPSRCTYCSFPTIVSQSSRQLIKDYLKVLCREIVLSQKLFKYKTVGQIYIGGGTPAILEANEMNQLLSTIVKYFRLKKNYELSIEMGRPELITEEKLKVLSHFGTTHLSINPQTLHEDTLLKINRRHTRAEFYDAFEKVSQYTKAKVNIDLIMGLIDENQKIYQNTLSEVSTLSPNFITVHTLCAKRGATGYYHNEANGVLDISTINTMWQFTYEHLTLAGYRPYYLYRQKRMVAPFENIGFSKEGYNSYNVLMMTERYPILGLGMGATSKIIMKDKTMTVLNYRNMRDYMEYYQQSIDEKSKLLV